jgi:hypothetical protein
MAASPGVIDRGVLRLERILNRVLFNCKRFMCAMAVRADMNVVPKRGFPRFRIAA